MADLRFNVDQAVEQLQAETKRATERLAESAAALERELRAVAAGAELVAEIVGAGWDVGKADAFHVMEIDTTDRGTMPPGGELELWLYGQRLGVSRLARPFEPGPYRVIVQITRLPQRCTRCGMEGHVASPPGQPARDNCREALGVTRP